jgi:hypothetical protein
MWRGVSADGSGAARAQPKSCQHGDDKSFRLVAHDAPENACRVESLKNFGHPVKQPGTHHQALFVAREKLEAHRLEAFIPGL